MKHELTNPSSDIEYFASLPSKVRQEVNLWTEVCGRIDKAKNKSVAIAEESNKLGHQRGFSGASIRRKYYAWKKTGWLAFIDQAKLTKQSSTHDIAEHFKSYCENNQRSSKAGYREMMRDFRAGKYFEDVGTWRDVWENENPDVAVPHNCPSDWTPKGWTYRNLMRCAGLTAYEVTASRIGRGAARDFLPSVYSTRAGLKPGSIYQFDDMWHDARVNFLGHNNKARRPIELACLDVYSASRVAYGIKPRLEDIETGKLKNLTEGDMRMLLAHVLINIGYRKDGTQLVVEHGTAAVGGELETMLTQMTGGAVTIKRSGIISDQIHKGLFLGQGRGNFKLKAALESQHALMHSEAASIVGQMGKDRDHSPEQQYGMQQYNAQLIKAAAALPAERAQLLRYPFLPFDQYVSVIGDLYNTLDWRTDHNLEGWEAEGLIASEFRMSLTSDEWIPMDELFKGDEPVSPLVMEALDKIPGLCRTRKLSPREAWNRGKDELVQLPKAAMPLLLGPKLATSCTVHHDGLIKYHNREYGPGEFHYHARDVKGPDGFLVNLKPGQKYSVHINPFNLDECFVSDPDNGAFIGLAMRWKTVRKDDTEALNHQVGKQMHVEAELRKPLAIRGQKAIKAKADMHDHNAKVFRGDAVTPDEIEREERDLGTEISEEEMAAVLAHRPEPTYQFSEEEIAATLEDDLEEDPDYSALI
jgi:hypothetical protein